MLDTLGLTAEAKSERRHWIGGSDANIIMGGDAEKLLRLWREKRGEAEPEDLSGILPVMLGSFTEPFNAAWYERQTGEAVTNRGDVVTLDNGLPMRATLDGMAGGQVFEAKHVGDRQTPFSVWERYLPQLAHNSICAGSHGAVLSVIRGNADWFILQYERNAEYEADLIAAEAAFWRCVQDGTPPAPLPPPPMPKPKGTVEYDMRESNAWAVNAAVYVETMAAATRHDDAKKAIKDLCPADASRAFGHGIELRRDKRGALRFYAQGDDE